MNSSALLASLVLLLCPVFSQTPSGAIALPKRLHIRAVLDKTVDSKKAKPGDTVRMTVLAEEMDGDRVVIGKGAKLYGRVMEVTTLGGPESPSRLMVVIEKAEWKGRLVPLRAYIVAQGLLRQVVSVPAGSDCNKYVLKDAPFGRNCGDTPGSGQVTIATKDSPQLNDISIVGAGRDGPTTLVSRSRSIVLPKQTVVLLRNIEQ